MSLHARHIFDWDDVRAGQNFLLLPGDMYNSTGAVLNLITYFANVTAEDASKRMAPLLDEAKSLGFLVEKENVIEALANDLLLVSDAPAGNNGIAGSRLIPAMAYRDNPDTIGRGLAALIEQGVQQ